jgi:CRP-like cAMP-binding protein/serine/threonine protein kinase
MGCNNSKEAIEGASGGGGRSGISMNPANNVNHEESQAMHIAARKGAKRNNVIAQTDLESDFDAPVFAKSSHQEKVIKDCITGPDAFFFTDIGDAELTMLVNAMQPRDIKSGDEVITQGDPGDYFYVIEDGSYAAYVNGKKVKDYSKGMFFGELALAYNKPRAATVKAVSKGKLLALDANVFRRVIGMAAKGRYDSILLALQKVDILWNSSNPSMSNLSMEELSKVAEIVEMQNHKIGDQIIRKGEVGKLFYMIKSGHVIVKNKSESGTTLADTTLGPGTYFGELALIRDAPRAADVYAKTDCQLLWIDKDAFLSILGPLQEVIDHNANMRLLDSVTLFQLLTKKEKRAIYDSFIPEVFEKGQIIIEEGTVGSKFYIVKEGEAKLILHGKEVRDKDDKLVKRFKGHYFGEMALMHDEPRNATIEAVTQCEVLTLDRKKFVQLVAIKDVQDKLVKLNDEHKRINNNSNISNIKFVDLRELAVLGSGTFGRVTLVQNKGNKEVYALKAMLKSEIVMHKQQDNVMNEKNCMMGCNHPFILRLFQTFRDSQKLYMLLEFVQGGELFSVLHPAHPVSEQDGVNNQDAMFYSAGVLLGIAYLHNERNVSYRDMKPENCLIDNKGYPKLVDFGFAKVIATKSYTLCGTPEYLAPELVLGRGHNKSVDYWAFGIMVFEMQTGYSPFSDDNMDQTAICRNIIKQKLEFPKGFDSDCKNMCKGLLTRPVESRLGNLKGGTEDIRLHRWFAGFDWKGYYDQKMKAPMVPQVKSITDTSHFDPYAADDHVIDPNYKDTGNWDENF